MADIRDRSTAVLALVAVVVGVVIIGASLFHHDGDIAGVAKFGRAESAAERTAHVEDVLDRSVSALDDVGHDGSMFFLQSLDPFYLSPDEHAVHLDRQLYRAQRMLYPTLASVGGLLPAEAILWNMALVNIAAIALGTAATSRLAVRRGGTPWLGLAFAFNPGIIFETDLSGAGVLALAAALMATLRLEEGNERSAIRWFVAAVLAREVMLLYVAGVCVYRLWQQRRVPWKLGLVPASAVAAWAAYLRLRLDPAADTDQVREFAAPLGGIIDSLGHWTAEPISGALAAGILAVMALLIVRTWQNPNPLGAGAIAFIPLALVMSEQVWWHFFNYTRALAPVLTAYAVIALSDRTPTADGSLRDAQPSTMATSSSSDGISTPGT